MKTASIYGAFNARWLEPEDVARSFVPTTHFNSLIRFQNSLLMGPRGCGKTTLLKMLTRRAQRVWQTERIKREAYWKEYRRPDFEAIYIPSDVRWSAELNSVAQELRQVPIEAERVQRASVSISTLIEATKVFQDIADERGFEPTPVVKQLISHLELGAMIPSFKEIRLRLLRWMDNLHNLVIRRDMDGLTRALNGLPMSLTSHALSALTLACTVFQEYASEIAPSRWALCFDELEIAPEWLQSELFGSLRSYDQRFLLKITWSPILPSDLLKQRERQHDYTAIRMWHGHAADAKPFCKEFSTRYIQDRFANPAIGPRDVFGPSAFAQEETESFDVYSQGSQIWHAMVRLAKRDTSFRSYLLDHGLRPENPSADTGSVRDESLRKIKPIVLLREAYLKHAESSVKKRSRKNVALYYGEDSIYAMSEGNPRLLAGLLNELLDVDIRPSVDGTPWIKPEIQSRTLYAASQRMLTGIKAYPIHRERKAPPLSTIIDRLAKYLHSELVTGEFRADPVGSFFVDEDVSAEVISEISIGLLIGAFVHVGSSMSDIPSSVLGSRIRLSYMLAPSFKLLFRNYREIRLSTALRISASSQRLMF